MNLDGAEEPVGNEFPRPDVRHASFAMTTTQHGSHRAMVPIGNYEEIMPLDILPTQLQSMQNA